MNSVVIETETLGKNIFINVKENNTQIIPEYIFVRVPGKEGIKIEQYMTLETAMALIKQQNITKQSTK
jgi:hypothetical protein